MELHQRAAFIILPIALVGVIANWTVSILIIKLKSMKNAFGKLTLSQSIGDAMHSTIFVLYFVPMVYFNNKWMEINSMYCGHALLIVYDISTYSHLFISLNRFSAIMFPIKYDTIFSMDHTNIMVIFSWTLAIFPSLYLYVYNDCKFFFINDFWVFTFSTTPVCLTITWYADFLKYNSIVISIVVIDIITVIKTRMLSKRLASSTISAKRSNEINFLKQACLQAVVFLCELITYFIITPKVGADKRWLRFFLSTVAWVCVHTLDGVITIAFNEEFRKYIWRSIPLNCSGWHGGELDGSHIDHKVEIDEKHIWKIDTITVNCDSQWMKDNSKYCGHFLILVYEISTYSHFFISLNRFSAVMFPMNYDTIFSMKHTNMMVAFSWAFTVFPAFYLYGYHDCKSSFIDDNWMFAFSTNPVCLQITWYADFLKNNLLVILIVVIDIITVIKTRIINKKLAASAISAQRINEINFLKQACLQGFIFFCELITYFIITPKIRVEKRWLRFFLSTVAWCCVHMLDGIITLVFNIEFWKFIQRNIRLNSDSVSTHIT